MLIEDIQDKKINLRVTWIKGKQTNSVIIVVQIKITKRYRFIPIRLADFRKLNDAKCCGAVGHRTPAELLVG